MTTIPPNGNPGIVPPWLRRYTPEGETVASNPVPSFIRASGSYPVREGYTVHEVQRLLTHNGFAEVTPDDLPARG